MQLRCVVHWASEADHKGRRCHGNGSDHIRAGDLPDHNPRRAQRLRRPEAFESKEGCNRRLSLQLELVRVPYGRLLHGQHWPEAQNLL
eukprot:6206540-Pleurochrysis_carterae.AAC.1